MIAADETPLTPTAGRQIVVLAMGGTIAGLAADPLQAMHYRAGQIPVADLLAALPCALPPGLHSEQVAQIDSKDMGAGHWQRLAARCRHWLAQPDLQALVLTHGTDTLEETAYFLHALLAPRKPVVLTCAMRPANAPDSDGPQNLCDALAVAQSGQAQGVLAVCAGEIHAAVDVQKHHAWQLNAFTSGPPGPLGRVAQGQVQWLRPVPAIAVPLNCHLPAPDPWPWVEIVTSHADARADLVLALLHQGVRGLVVAGTGNARVHEALLAPLRQCVAAGVRVVLVTRCASPQLLRPAALSEFEDAGDLTPVKARIALQLQLMSADV